MISFEEHRRLEAESSLVVWYPKIMDLIPTPRTEILELSGKEIRSLYELLSEGPSCPIGDNLKKKIFEKAALIGYPLFLRSDQASGKHEWKETCYVAEEAELIQHVRNLVAWHADAGIVGLPFSALVFREYVPLESTFTAFNHMPVARERRYFVRDGTVECHHRYWIENAIHGYGYKLPEDWKERLAALNQESPCEVGLLSLFAQRFGEQLPGYWSVDFAMTRDQEWIMIDAARGEVSWHDASCPHCPEDQKRPEKGVTMDWFVEKE